MARLWRRRGVSETEGGAALTEAARANLPQPLPAYPTGAAVARAGYDPGVPMGGTSVRQPTATLTQGRAELMDQLYGAYLACPWSSACVDVIARTITAGGIEIVPDIEAADDPSELLKNKPKPTKQVADLQRMWDFTNPREDARQLCRGMVTDLDVTGDAFLEVVWFLGLPVAVYSLESASMTPIADEHGNVAEYIQTVEPNREVHFAPAQVIQVSLDAPRGGVYGISPTQKLLVPITNWLFTAGLLKTTMRKGNPPRAHFNYGAAADENTMKRDYERYLVQNVGIENTGNPLFTKGAQAQEFKPSAIAEYIETLKNERDVITSGYGVPNRKVGIFETGSLGGAGAEAGEDRTFEVNTCGPVSTLVLEKLNFAFLPAFGIDGWKQRFGQVDWRDDQTIEQMRDMRIRNGTYTLNRARAELGEPPADGGDEPVIIDRTNLVAWRDVPELSKALLQTQQAKAEAPGGVVPAPPAPGGKGGGTISGVKPTAGGAESDDDEEDLLEYERRRQAARRAIAELARGR